MSYDIGLEDGDGYLKLDTPHGEAGGTYQIGGTLNAWLNITYNYSKYFYRVFGEKGIRGLYGKTAGDSIEWLQQGIDQLGDDPPDDDYWRSTAGNAKASLCGLLVIARQAVTEGMGDAKWGGD